MNSGTGRPPLGFGPPTALRGVRGPVAALSLLVGGFLVGSCPVRVQSGAETTLYMQFPVKPFDLAEERAAFLRVAGDRFRGTRSEFRESRALARSLLERGDARGAVVIGEDEERPTPESGIVIEAAAGQDGYVPCTSWTRITTGPDGARVLRVCLFEPRDAFSLLKMTSGEDVVLLRRVRIGGPTLLDRFRDLFPRTRTVRMPRLERVTSPQVRVASARMPAPVRDALLLVARDLVDAREDLAVPPPWCLRAPRNEWADVRIRSGPDVAFEHAAPTFARSGVRLQDRQAQALADLVEIATRDLAFRPCGAVDGDLDWIARRRARGETAEGFEEARAELLEAFARDR